MNKLMSKLSSMLTDGTDNLWSATRFSMLLAVVLSNVLVLGVWTYLSLKQGKILDIPWNVITIYTAANSVTIGGKVLQKKYESANNNNANDGSNGGA